MPFSVICTIVSTSQPATAEPPIWTDGFNKFQSHNLMVNLRGWWILLALLCFTKIKLERTPTVCPSKFFLLSFTRKSLHKLYYVYRSLREEPSQKLALAAHVPSQAWWFPNAPCPPGYPFQQWFPTSPIFSPSYKGTKCSSHTWPLDVLQSPLLCRSSRCQRAAYSSRCSWTITCHLVGDWGRSRMRFRRSFFMGFNDIQLWYVMINHGILLGTKKNQPISDIGLSWIIMAISGHGILILRFFKRNHEACFHPYVVTLSRYPPWPSIQFATALGVVFRLGKPLLAASTGHSAE